MKKLIVITILMVFLFTGYKANEAFRYFNTQVSVTKAPKTIVENSPNSNKTEPNPKDASIIPNNTSEPFIGRMNLDSETEIFSMELGKLRNL